MLLIPKKDFPKMLNPMGLKRGDIVEIEIAEATPDYITLDPQSLKLNVVHNPGEPREPLHKQMKPKNAGNMPLPDLKNMISKPPMGPPAGAPPPMAPPPPSTPPPMPPK